MDKEENTEQAPLLHRRNGESEICRISEEDCGAADEAFMDRSVYYVSRWDRKLQEIIVIRIMQSFICGFSLRRENVFVSITSRHRKINYRSFWT